MSLLFPRLVILPLRQLDWRRQLCRPLVGVAEAPYPHVAVVRGMEGNDFLVVNRSGDRKSDERKIADARANTRAQTWSWQVAQESGILFWKKPSLLRGMGDPRVPLPQMATDGGGIDDLATELLLIPDAMAEAARTLRTETLFCIVPKRGWLMVSRGEVGNPFAAQSMHDAASGIASRGGRSAIGAGAVLIWQGGKLIGVDGRDGTSGYISMQGEDEATWWPARP